jgi:NitT/TauT family transport system permease protein
MNKLKTFWIVIFLMIWEVIAKLKIISPLLFPSLEDIFRALIKDLFNGNLVNQIGFTLKMIFIAIIISIIIGIVLSFLSTKYRMISSLVDTLIMLLHPLPGIALFPILIGFIGINEKSIIIIIVHSVLWPLVLNLTTAYKLCPDMYLKIADNFQLSSLEKLIKVYFPYGIPYFISGLKIGYARAFRALISAEMVFGAVSSYGGLGYYIFTKRVFMNTAGMYAGLIVIIIIGMIIEDVVFKQIEKHTFEKWGSYENIRN